MIDRVIYEAAEKASEKYPTIGWRYDVRRVPLSRMQSLLLLLKGFAKLEWNWRRETSEFLPIKPGEPGYDDAPYEMSVIWDLRIGGRADS